MEYLIGVSQELSLARSLEQITTVVRKAARELCAADGATFILSEGDLCYYVDEDAIAPLWKGRRFPQKICVSGWSIIHKQTAVIEDIYADERVLHEAYRPTFVKSMVMVPIRETNPLGAIGAYWAEKYRAPDECIALIRSLANLTAIAIENVQLIEKLTAANHELERSVQMRDEFLSIASHELRTPLSSLSLQLQMLSRGIIPNKQKTEGVSDGFSKAIDVSLKQVRRLGALVESLLDVSRIRLERLQLEHSKFDLSQLVGNLLEQCALELGAANCKLESKLEPGLIGNWDRMRIEQVVTNLISNVCKYAVNAPVLVSTSRSGDSAVLTVQDKGPGISRDKQPKIFERFERAASTTHTSGLGLGLYITKALVEAHGGKIRVESEPEKGTKFTAELPFKVGEPTHA